MHCINVVTPPTPLPKICCVTTSAPMDGWMDISTRMQCDTFYELTSY